MTIRSEDFASDSPPSRTMGTECEYNMQLSDKGGVPTYAFVDSTHLRNNGIANDSGFLGSSHGSGRIYTDMDMVEYATVESIGSAAAAVEDIEGILRAIDIVDRHPAGHGGMYRMAGSYIPEGKMGGYKKYTGTTDTSSGFHASYMIPPYATESIHFPWLAPSQLASQIWAMGGTLRETGFVFSQKVWASGGFPIEYSQVRRTDHGSKPMIMVPSSNTDGDTVGGDWQRAEVRIADPGMSLVNRWLAFSAVSLSLRLVEQTNLFTEQTLRAASLYDIPYAARKYASDLTLSQTVQSQNGTTMNVVDHQEAMLELFESMDQKIQLPVEERLAIPEIRALIDGLRRSRPQVAEYDTTVRLRAEFAAKHQFVSNGRPQTEISSRDAVALQRNHLWSRVDPGGPGMKFWTVMTERDPLTSVVRSLAKAAGHSKRAVLRSQIIDNPDDVRIVKNWSQFQLPGNQTMFSLGDASGS